MTEPREMELGPCLLHRKMLSAGVPSTRHYDPGLSRQPGVARHPRERAGALS
jgi:hypothetical protein